MGEEEAKKYTCPECHEEFDAPHSLAVHLERHREVRPPVLSKRGKHRSRPCPGGCGRHFVGKMEFKEHTALCDGSAPLAARGGGGAMDTLRSAPAGPVGPTVTEERKEAGMLVPCPRCGKKCRGKSGLGGHMARGGCAKGQAGIGLSARAITAPLLEKARIHREMALKLEQVAREVEALLQ